MFKRMNYYGRHNIPFLFILDFRLQEPIVIPLEEAAEQGVFFDINGKKNIIRTSNLPEQIQFQKYPISYQHYLKGFELVQHHLKRGDSFLTN